MNKLQTRIQQRGQGGFTLIELLVVIAILGILAGVVVFAVGNSTDSAKENACKAEKRAVSTAANAVKAEGLTDPAVIATPGAATTAIGAYLQDATVGATAVTTEYFVATTALSGTDLVTTITANGTAVDGCNDGTNGALPTPVKLN